MSLPIGLTCIKYGNVFGALIEPDEQKLRGLRLKYACESCISNAAAAKNVTPSSEENWRVLVKELKS
jgi:hypothetical protein